MEKSKKRLISFARNCDQWIRKTRKRKYKTLDFGYEPRRIFGVVQRFNKHFTCHLLGKYVLVRRSRSSYVWQGVGIASVVIGGAGDMAAIQYRRQARVQGKEVIQNCKWACKWRDRQERRWILLCTGYRINVVGNRSWPASGSLCPCWWVATFTRNRKIILFYRAQTRLCP
jgi:hypothetical protein